MHNPHFDLLALALQCKKVGFNKVIKMVYDLTAELKNEAQDDLGKKGSKDKKKAQEWQGVNSNSCSTFQSCTRPLPQKHPKRHEAY